VRNLNGTVQQLAKRQDDISNLLKHLTQNQATQRNAWTSGATFEIDSYPSEEQIESDFFCGGGALAK